MYLTWWGRYKQWTRRVSNQARRGLIMILHMMVIPIQVHSHQTAASTHTIWKSTCPGSITSTHQVMVVRVVVVALHYLVGRIPNFTSNKFVASLWNLDKLIKLCWGWWEDMVIFGFAFASVVGFAAVATGAVSWASTNFVQALLSFSGSGWRGWWVD